MGQGILSFDEHVRALLSGLLMGNLYFVNGDAGDDNANGLDWGHSLKSLDCARRKVTSNNNDYILAAGAITVSAAIAWATPRLHVIGAGNREDFGSLYRGAQVAVSYIGTGTGAMSLAASNGAKAMEIGGLYIYTSSSSSSQVMIDDLGSAGVYLHDCTFENTAESATPPVFLDIETANWMIKRCKFLNIEKAIDSAARIFIEDCLIQTNGTSAIGVHLSNSAADYSHIVGNIFNLGGGTTDTAIKLVANVTGCTIHRNWISNECNDPISIGTDTDHIVSGNFVDTLIAANTSSAIQWKGVQT